MTTRIEAPPTQGRLRSAWTASHTPVAGVPRWARIAAYAIPLAVLPSVLWRIAVIFFGHRQWPGRGLGRGVPAPDTRVGRPESTDVSCRHPSPRLRAPWCSRVCGRAWTPVDGSHSRHRDLPGPPSRAPHSPRNTGTGARLEASGWRPVGRLEATRSDAEPGSSFVKYGGLHAANAASQPLLRR
jgi:hypothetical protein